MGRTPRAPANRPTSGPGPRRRVAPSRTLHHFLSARSRETDGTHPPRRGDHGGCPSRRPRRERPPLSLARTREAATRLALLPLMVMAAGLGPGCKTCASASLVFRPVLFRTTTAALRKPRRRFLRCPPPAASTRWVGHAPTRESHLARSRPILRPLQAAAWPPLKPRLRCESSAKARSGCSCSLPSRASGYRPAAVAEPFERGKVLQFDLGHVADAAGAGFALGALTAVDGARNEARERMLASIPYDALPTARGAAPTTAVPGAITFRGPTDTDRVRVLLKEIEEGEVQRLVCRTVGIGLGAACVRTCSADSGKAQGLSDAERRADARDAGGRPSSAVRSFSQRRRPRVARRRRRHADHWYMSDRSSWRPLANRPRAVDRGRPSPRSAATPGPFDYRRPARPRASCRLISTDASSAWTSSPLATSRPSCRSRAGSRRSRRSLRRRRSPHWPGSRLCRDPSHPCYVGCCLREATCCFCDATCPGQTNPTG